MFEVAGSKESPARFFSNGSGAIPWWGIFVSDSSGVAGADINHCIIEDGYRGIRARESISIRNTTFDNCVIAVSIATADSVFIDSTTIRGTDLGINLLQGSKLTLLNSTVENSGFYGVEVYTGATLYANNTSFVNNDVGLYIHRQDSLWVKGSIENCTFQDNDIGVSAYNIGDSVVTIRGCTIDNNEEKTAGIYCLTGGNIRIKTNTIRNSQSGIYAYNSHPRITSKNVIQNNTVGIKCDQNATAMVESTTVTLNGTGVGALNSGDPDLGHAAGGGGLSKGYNILNNNTTYFVSNLTGGLAIMAEKNYWGGSSPRNPDCFPPASKIYGSVDYDPALCALSLVAPLFVRDDTTPTPSTFRLGQNYPNPFNPTTTIAYEVPTPGSPVKIVIYNVKGQVVKTLLHEVKPPGFYSIRWDGTTDRGSPVASGIYFVQMRATGFVNSKKLVILK